MHANNFVRSFGGAGQFCNRNWRRIAGNYSFRLQYFVQRWQQWFFNVGILNNRLNLSPFSYLNHEVDILFAQLVQIVHIADSAVECSDFIIGEFVLGELLLQPRADKLLRLFERDLVWVVDGDIEPSNSVGHDGNTCPHLSRTHHSKRADVVVMRK